MTRMRRPGGGEADRIDVRQVSPRQDDRGTLLLDELERRLEAAFPALSDLRAAEPCVWACACFLVDGSRG
jgi:hypothetical protein